MCGIAGILYFDKNRPIEPEILHQMSRELSHRGPDAEGFWIDQGIGLMHRRLSIIDLAGGDQPLSNEDDSIQIIFNGEIYNYQTLREELIQKGHRFQTHSDTEVLVHLYEEMGGQFVERLRGMFAFALWDREKKCLLLGRDRLGIKPLYFFRDDEKLVFGSEIKALLAHPEVPRELNPTALEDYLTYGIVPGPGSIFQRIEKLPPAHTLSASQSHVPEQPVRYWQLTMAPDHSRPPEEWIEAIQAKLTEAVKLHLIADVPVGAFLSGGLDSSAIVAATHGLTSGQLQTFSIGFGDQKWSELPYALQVAEKFDTQHTEEVVTPDAVELLDELSHFYDEPFADSSALPTFLVSRLAGKKVKVVVSGDGGDECFGGYARYAHDLKEASIRKWLPQWLRRAILAPIARAWPKADWLPRPLRAKTRLTNLSLDEASAYANTLAICREPFRRQLLSGDVRSQLGNHRPEEPVRYHYRQSRSRHPLDGMLTADIHTLLPDDFLVKVDRASMAHGLEVRPPLLDHELMEMAAQIPAKHKVHNGETKWIFKQAVKHQLPPGLIDRPKQGFELPLDQWLRDPLREIFEESVLHSRSSIAPLVNQQQVNDLYQQHTAGTGRHGGVLWSLLVLARWAERYLSAPAPHQAHKVG